MMLGLYRNSTILRRSWPGLLTLVVIVIGVLIWSDHSITQASTTEVICDNKDSCFSKHQTAGAWGYIPDPNQGVGSQNSYNQHAYWTYNSHNQALDSGTWRPNLPQEGTYDVYIWYPHFPGFVPETNNANYQVHHADGDYHFTWNQALNAGKWNKVATVRCRAGTECYVKLTDKTSEANATRRVWFDAVKFVLQQPPSNNTISGQVRDSSGNGVIGVTVSDGTRTAITNASGNYTLSDVPAGSYTLRATKASCTFTPSARTVTVPPNIIGQNFTAACTAPTYTVSGRIMDNSGTGIVGVSVSDGTRTATTDANGNYTINGVPTGSYTLTPSRSGYTFMPTMRSVAVKSNMTGQNFTATAIPQATATATHTPQATATRTHTPQPTATRTFTPQPMATATHTPQPTATATHTIHTYRVSGRVTSNGTGLPGVTISDGTRTATTDANGHYTLNNVPTGSYILTATKANCTFAPPQQPVTVPVRRGWRNGEESNEPNFVATCIDTVPPDGKITAPLQGATINNAPLTISAEAWDNPGGSGVARVEFKVYYNNAWREAGQSTTSPYHVRWTPPAGLGSQRIKFAIHVYDKAGNRRIDPGGIIEVNFNPPIDNGFKLPYPGGTTYMCTQGNHSAFSHTGQYAFAFDFGIPRGHEVVAARNGRVVAVKGDSTLGGCHSNYRPYANYIRIRHIDNTDTLYVHLDSVSVSHGQSVERGQVIGRSGQTGWSCGAHLHFDRRNAGSSWTIPVSFLDVPGGVPYTGKSYTSGNYRGQAVALLQAIEQSALQEGDAVAPIGNVQFHLTGATPYTLWLMAEDDTTSLNSLEMRLASAEEDLEQATWQPFASETTWETTTVWVQFRDEAGNISDSYADTLDMVATSPIQASFVISPTVCASTEVPIVNQTTPFCPQCRWEWDLGNGVTSNETDPAPVMYPEGTHTIALRVTGASDTSSTSEQVTVLPSPDATFEVTRTGNTVTVVASDTDATSWEWDFGDGTTATGQTATHTYTVETLATEQPVIKLTVHGSNACSGTAAFQILQDTPQTVYLPLIVR